MSIYTSWAAPSDGEHTDECAVWEKHDDSWEFTDRPCDCGQPDAPLAYQGSHVLPSDTDPRRGYVDIASIPNHITRDGRDDGPENGAPWPYLRFGVNDERVVLTRRNVEQVAAALNEWLRETSATDDRMSVACRAAIDLLARVPYESGTEIGELIEERRSQLFAAQAAPSEPGNLASPFDTKKGGGNGNEPRMPGSLGAAALPPDAHADAATIRDNLTHIGTSWDDEAKHSPNCPGCQAEAALERLVAALPDAPAETHTEAAAGDAGQ